MWQKTSFSSLCSFQFVNVFLEWHWPCDISIFKQWSDKRCVQQNSTNVFPSRYVKLLLISPSWRFALRTTASTCCSNFNSLSTITPRSLSHFDSSSTTVLHHYLPESMSSLADCRLQPSLRILHLDILNWSSQILDQDCNTESLFVISDSHWDYEWWQTALYHLQISLTKLNKTSGRSLM